MTLPEAIEAYREKFGESPDVFDAGPDVLEQILEALKTGKPIPEPDVPPGALT